LTEIGCSKNDLDTPFLWVDLDALAANIATLAGFFRDAGVGWRPHVKGVKVPAIAHQMLAAGALGVTCAKLGEAEVMAAAGIGDILIANQVVGPTGMRAPATGRRVVVDRATSPGGAAAWRRGGGALVEVEIGMGRAGAARAGGALSPAGAGRLRCRGWPGRAPPAAKWTSTGAGS
jgi:D-serine deaminase-like pyridoxal phosphate-dependent protein